MATRLNLRAIALVAVGILGMVVCLGIGLFYVSGELSSSLGGLGYVALAIGLLAALLLGVGVTRLIRHGKPNDGA